MPTKAPIHRSNPKAPRVETRGNSGQRGYDAEWNRFSRWYRDEVEPLCVECKAKGIITPSRAVDHIIKLSVAPERKYDLSNLQSLCGRCHAIKTARGE